MAPCPTAVRGRGSIAAVGSTARALRLRSVQINPAVLLECSARRVHPCQTAPAWGKGELWTPWCGFVPFSQVQTCWNREVRDGLAPGRWMLRSLKIPLLQRQGVAAPWHRSLPGKGRDGGWALHQGPASCSSDPTGSGATKESVILLSIIPGTSYAQTLIPVLTADGRSHPRGCLIGTLKIKSQVLIAALGSGACNSGMLGSDFAPPEHCIGDTNICGASWVCAVTPHCCFTPASGERPSQGRNKKPREEFQQEFSCHSIVCSQILCPPAAPECLCCGRSSGFVLRHGTAGQ